MSTKNKPLSPILAPAVAIMNRLKYPQKFALISLFFAIPLATVMFLLISEINDRIEFAEKEIVGDAYLRPLRQLLEHVPAARSLAHSYAKGQITVRPELIESHSRTGFFAQSILERGSMTAEEKAELITLTGLVRSNSEATRAGLEVGFRNNPAQNLKPRLEELVQNSVAQTEELLKRIDSEIIDAPQLTMTQESLAALTRKTLEKDFSLWDRTVGELDGLLRTRIEGFAHKKRLVEVLSVLMLALVGYLLVGFYWAVMRTVSGLQEASDAMIQGNLTGSVSLGYPG